MAVQQMLQTHTAVVWLAAGANADALARWGVPINHMVVVTEAPAKSNPETAKEIYRVLLTGKKSAGLPKQGTI
jgi:hypothetical protein